MCDCKNICTNFKPIPKQKSICEDCTGDYFQDRCGSMETAIHSAETGKVITCDKFTQKTCGNCVQHGEHEENYGKRGQCFAEEELCSWLCDEHKADKDCQWKPIPAEPVCETCKGRKAICALCGCPIGDCFGDDQGLDRPRPCPTCQDKPKKVKVNLIYEEGEPCIVEPEGLTDEPGEVKVEKVENCNDCIKFKQCLKAYTANGCLGFERKGKPGEEKRLMVPIQRYEKYRDLLETWSAWWNNIGRHHFTHNIIPPISETGETLSCSICSGITDCNYDRCDVCLRDMNK